MARAPAEEAVFTGADDPSASPVAQQIIKQLLDRGIQPTAGNMRRAVEANARGTGVSGPDPLEGVRNDVVENTTSTAARAAPRQNPPNANLGGNPYGDEGPLPNPVSPKEPFVDPATGILMTTGGMDMPTALGPPLGALIVAASRIPGLRNLLPGIGDISKLSLNPNSGALPAPPPAQLAAPASRLPPPNTPSIAPGQGGIPTMTVTPPASAPTTSASPPSVIRMPGPTAPPTPTAAPPAPPPAPVAPPTAAAPGRPPIEFVKPDPARIRALQLQLAKRPPGMGQGNPFTNVR